VLLAVGALAAAVLPDAAFAGKDPGKAAGSCGTSTTSQQTHDGTFSNGISYNGHGQGFNTQDCEPNGP
jgi:hypothetical protein